MQKIFNMVLATAMMLFIISCSDDSNSVEPKKIVANSMILIPAGSFQMGNTGAFIGYDNEKPVRTVTISKAFYMSKYEITRHQYNEVMGNTPDYFEGDNLPINYVQWYEAIAFCNKLSIKDGFDTCYSGNYDKIVCNWNANGYRLPTEAEWEYACKAGSTTDFYFGNLRIDTTYSLDSTIYKYAWLRWVGHELKAPQEVGQKLPNSFGLYDMCGNVREWCWDRFGNYDPESELDPKGTGTDSLRVRRGGGWDYGSEFARSSFRNAYYPYVRSPSVGFRIVRADN